MQRHPRNPILTRHNVPREGTHLSDVSSVFNPGATRFEGRYLLLLRVQNRGRETFLLRASSDDGISFKVDTTAVSIEGLERFPYSIYHLYDPRITKIDDSYYITCAADTDHGCRVLLIHTPDFKRYQYSGMVLDEDSRNGVLFPEQIKGKYYQLIRPNTSTLENSVTSGSEVHLLESANLKEWRFASKVFAGRPHYWDELVGSGPPPIKTKEGWLHIYHGVATHFQSVNIYQAGTVLLDLDNPAKVLARSRYNFLEPREMYELTGQVPNVVFPSGAIVGAYDRDGFAEKESPVFIYYGAADTSVCLFHSTIAELIAHTHEGHADERR